MENMSSEVAPQVSISTPPAPKAAASKVPKTKIIAVIGVVLVLFVLFSFHRRITVVQKRNSEIIKKLKDAEAKHGIKKA